ncbi:MAG: AzlC family ABC transporter permease [Pseudomonadota bacterium]
MFKFRVLGVAKPLQQREKAGSSAPETDPASLLPSTGAPLPRFGPVYDWAWFPRGARNLFSLPSLILCSAFIGFGGIVREVGIPPWQVIFMVPAIWALPSHLVLVAGIAAGASFLTIAPAVALAAMRMMPMTMALVPEIRVAGTKRWHLLLVSNLVAITAWVHTLQKAQEIPPRGRLPYFTGFALANMLAVTTTAAVVYSVAAVFPPILMAGLYFLTPLYFASTIWNTARFKAEHLALAFGFCFGPLVALVLPQANILLGGLLGGVFAFLAHLTVLKRQRVT